MFVWLLVFCVVVVAGVGVAFGAPAALGSLFWEHLRAHLVLARTARRLGLARLGRFPPRYSDGALLLETTPGFAPGMRAVVTAPSVGERFAIGARRADVKPASGIGDPAFDRAFHLVGSAADAMSRLDFGARQVLVGLSRRGVVHVSEREAEVRFTRVPRAAELIRLAATLAELRHVMSPRGTPEARLLEAARTEPDPEVRYRALGALLVVFPGSAEALEARAAPPPPPDASELEWLTAAIDEPRRLAAIACFVDRHAIGMEPVLAHMLREPSPAVRLAAAVALAALGTERSRVALEAAHRACGDDAAFARAIEGALERILARGTGVERGRLSLAPLAGADGGVSVAADAGDVELVSERAR